MQLKWIACLLKYRVKHEHCCHLWNTGWLWFNIKNTVSLFTLTEPGVSWFSQREWRLVSSILWRSHCPLAQVGPSEPGHHKSSRDPCVEDKGERAKTHKNIANVGKNRSVTLSSRRTSGTFLLVQLLSSHKLTHDNIYLVFYVLFDADWNPIQESILVWGNCF